MMRWASGVLRGLQPKRNFWPKLLTAAALLTVFIVWFTDAQPRQALHFWLSQADIRVNYSNSLHRLLAEGPVFPVNLREDVGVIVKTGYGTRDRCQATVANLVNGTYQGDVLIVQDYPVDFAPSMHDQSAKAVPIVDIIDWSMRNMPVDLVESSSRIAKYRAWCKAFADGDHDLAQSLSKDGGWELDAMKFVSTLVYAWQAMPRKQWYILIDDDTMLVEPSLHLLLQALDSSKHWYLGNAVGDYKVRFAHGGSSIILSQATLASLAEQHDDIVQKTYTEALTEVFGDKLLASTLLRMGVRLDERFVRLFSGETPYTSKIRRDRACDPIVSFHTLNQPELITTVAEKLHGLDHPLLWGQLVDTFGLVHLHQQETAPFRDIDLVGRPDDEVTIAPQVSHWSVCKDKCAAMPLKCLAFTWYEDSLDCLLAHWVTAGVSRKGVVSGVNRASTDLLAGRCEKT